MPVDGINVVLIGGAGLRRVALDDALQLTERAVGVEQAPCAALVGCEGEALEQLLLMLELLGWNADIVVSAEGLRRAMADREHKLLFIGVTRNVNVNFAVTRSKTVVFLGQAPADGRAIIAGKSISWMPIPLDVVQLERVIVNAG